MARFLLIHGSNHGAWCWEAVVRNLQELGHDALAIDLPGAGSDKTPLEEVTLASYADAVLGAVDGPTILVAHSAGGFAITEAAERDPSNIEGLVYVTAYVPAPGKSLVAMLKEAPEQPMRNAFELREDRVAFRFKDDFVAGPMYADCPPGTADHAAPRLSWQPFAPQTTPATLTGASDHLRKLYVFCDEDRGIPPAHQEQMAAGFREDESVHLPSGHSPFFQMPETLARTLADFADAT
ncbi:alpha/beta fold hydrolase [Maritimibacter sp. DP1N21-5]|uniref:alpha/beta fold hydrolase n=1 Tax=Maritimibacter sp. DP1N21-5 TaxID=2836867 RepID=UPI001C48D448|nr:alpha/beta fold hydrolase [Maritimibacter sp. DP1N21-5]MBV7408609.1 alpha/beta fold hydrolase [Maritimibacter sp. DP1N21-5]